jgi:hypothetical protein
VIDQVITALLVAALSTATGTSLSVPKPSGSPGDTNLLQVGGAAYWALPAFDPGPLGLSQYPKALPQRIDYPAGSLGVVDWGIGVGAHDLDKAVKDAAADGSDVVVVGHSEGSMVLDHLQADYLTDPDAPPAGKVTFLVYGSPERGILHVFFPDGTYIPIVGVTTQTPVDEQTQYDTTVVVGEYDLASDPIDRPWNLLALANSAMGFMTVHNVYSFVDYDTIPADHITSYTNDAGATITTVLIPSDHLPLTAPLRFVAPKLADEVDDVLRPAIDSAYVRHNPDDPYLSEGRLVIPDAAAAKTDTGPGKPTVTASAQKRTPVRDMLKHNPIRDALKQKPIRDALEHTPIRDALKHIPVRDALQRVDERATKHSSTGKHVKKSE